MRGGYLKLYRGIRELDIWKKRPFSEGQALIDLALRASYKTELVYVHRSFEKSHQGEVITSVVELAKDWGWSRGRVRNFVEKISHQAMIRYNSQAKRFTRITIGNFETFPLYVGVKSQEASQVMLQEKSEDARKNRACGALRSYKNNKKSKKKIYKRKGEGTEKKEKRSGEGKGAQIRITPAVELMLERKYGEVIEKERIRLWKMKMPDASKQHEMNEFLKELLRAESGRARA
jgi:hypothetical protein